MGNSWTLVALAILQLPFRPMQPWIPTLLPAVAIFLSIFSIACSLLLLQRPLGSVGIVCSVALNYTFVVTKTSCWAQRRWKGKYGKESFAYMCDCVPASTLEVENLAGTYSSHESSTSVWALTSNKDYQRLLNTNCAQWWVI